MGKTGKAKTIRQTDAAAASATSIGDLCNVSGLGGGMEENVDDLFAQMDDEVETAGGAAAASDDEQSAGLPTRTRKLQTFSVDEITLIPIRVELLRHKLMGELSSYLLDQVKGLRMPTFERWLIDTKLEEREKRKSGRGLTKLPPFDPVIPSPPEMNDGSTQRLMMEICEHNYQDEEEHAERICRELCRRSVEAAMEVHRLESRLSASRGSTSSFAKGRGGKKGKKKRKGKPSKEKIMLEKGEDGIYALVYVRRMSKKNRKANESRPEGDSDDDDDEEAKGDALVRDNGGKPFVVRINSAHYHKLRAMFDAVHPIQNASTIHIFHHLVFVLLLRYSSLAGGHLLKDLRGGGMQGSIHTEVFDFLGNFCAGMGHELAGECFASPLNANLGVGMYRSGFYGDLDRHFGSVGDFFQWKSGDVGKSAWYEANPPFSPGLMNEMAIQILKHLEAADEKKEALSFVVIVPPCSSDGSNSSGVPIARRYAATSFNAMLKSEYQSHHILLASGDHGYVEGAQHLRPTQFKTSMYDTSVILMQSKKARKDMKNTSTGKGWRDKFEAGIRAAFCSGHEDEIADRKRKMDDHDGKRVGPIGPEKRRQKKDAHRKKKKKKKSRAG